MNYLSKRENGTYCIIVGGCPANNYTDKQTCINIAEKQRIKLSNEVWDCLTGQFITE